MSVKLKRRGAPAVIEDSVAIIDGIGHRIYAFWIFDEKPFISYRCTYFRGAVRRVDRIDAWCEVGDLEYKESSVRQRGVTPCPKCWTEDMDG